MAKRLFFVTTNDHKFEEVRLMLEKHDIELLQSKIPIVEKKYDSEKEVSISKALAAVKQLNAPLIVEDTGIYFEEYNNFPGPNAHVVFSGIGFEGILRLLENKKRGAFFRTTIAYCKPGQMPVTFTGVCKGEIAEQVSDVINFDYDALFIPEGETRTFSEMSKQEKEQYSHRKKAVEEFLRWYNEQKL
ncbi:RdgB/HAM1 family non-canonical purine NTP pyrophosphatase [Candidatus Woesearchaeota archaeon]|nr:MAG: RdgB/HAM1 family non-canonical purine NTP pyrophosphatase [Candidatus Woesearchaeota archaeon]